MNVDLPTMDKNFFENWSQLNVKQNWRSLSGESRMFETIKILSRERRPHFEVKELGNQKDYVWRRYGNHLYETFPLFFQHVWQHLNKSGDQKIGTLYEKVGPEGEKRFSICEDFLGIKPILFQKKSILEGSKLESFTILW